MNNKTFKPGDLIRLSETIHWWDVPNKSVKHLTENTIGIVISFHLLGHVPYYKCLVGSEAYLFNEIHLRPLDK